MSDQSDDLRQLFQDAAADIRPQGSLDDLLERTKKVDPMTRRWFLPVVAAAAVIGLAVGGAVWLSNDSSSPDDRGSVGTPTATPSTTGTGTTFESAIYYLGDTANGPRLFAEPATYHVDPQPGITETRQARAMAAGNTLIDRTPDDPDYRSVWTRDSYLVGLGTSTDGRTLTVTLADSAPEDRPAGMSMQTARLSVEELVRTIQAGYGVPGVAVEFMATPADEGAPFTRIDKLLGVDTSRPIRESAADDVLAPVQITSPANGATVSSGDLEVSGVASAFEANVVWELMVGGDTVVQNGHATAQECCTLSPYKFTIKDLQPGSYTLVVHDEDMSGEGRPVNQDTKDIVVR